MHSQPHGGPCLSGAQAGPGRPAMFRCLPTHQEEGGLGMVVHVGPLGDKTPKNPWPLVQPTPPLGLPQANPTNSLGGLVLEPSYPTLNSPSPTARGRNGVGCGQGRCAGPLGSVPPQGAWLGGLLGHPPKFRIVSSKCPTVGPARDKVPNPPCFDPATLDPCLGWHWGARCQVVPRGTPWPSPWGTPAAVPWSPCGRQPTKP